jgi:hypothetical protein
VLLAWKAFVDGNEGVESALHGVQEVTVVEVAPAHFGRGSDFVAWQALAKPLWHTGIKEHSHRKDGRWLRRHRLREER